MLFSKLNTLSNELITKKFKLLAIFFCLFIILPTTSHAARENWYSYWALGIANHDHPPGFESYLSQRENQPGVSRISLGIDILGFYFPVDDESNLLLGFIINGTADSLQDDSGNAEQYNFYLYDISAMYFLGSEPGDGLFLRGDIGKAKLRIIDTRFNNSSSNGGDGTGYVLGIGYSLVTQAQSRILLGLNVIKRKIDNRNYDATSFTVGVLF